MASDLQAAYQFGQFTLVPSQKRLLSDREMVPLAPKVFDTLVLLVENQGRLIQKEEFLKALWPNSVVEEQALAHNISQLRKVLRDPAEDPKVIETVPKRGYRFIAPVRASGESPAVLAPSGAVPSAIQPLRGPRWAVLAMLAGVLVLATGATIYVYFRHTGPEAAGVPPAMHSLAVLPLENLSGDKEQEYFADGMTDALTTDLAQVGSLRVISRTSAMRFKGSKDDLPQIGRALKVDAVVEGTVARVESRVRITAQLIEASSDHHLWAKSYERDLKDVLALQDEIAQDITQQIRVKLTPKERSLLTQAHAVDPEAYDDYLMGSYWWDQLTVEGDKKACDYFHKAIAKDPNYALAYVGMGECSAAGHGTADKSREAFVKALALDPSLAEAHTMLSGIKFLSDRDWSGAEAELNQAIALNPNYAPAHNGYSFFLVAMGRLDEAMREIERARDLDPYSAPITLWLGQVLYHARRYDDALRENRRGLGMHPDTGAFYWNMADIYEQKKMFAEAFAARQQALGLFKDPRVPALADAYKRSGYKGYLLKQAEFEESHNPPYAAHIYALLNDEPRAIDALETAYNKVFGAIVFIRTAPELDSIRSSPRFRELVRRIGFPESVNRHEVN
jgi:TolB-like protein/DNA-binding winged helix-turn-helix (wHTH) protein/Tfp pilus assembly protein PilF